MNGFILLHRELLQKPIWQQSTPAQRSVLIAILCLANHETKYWEWKGSRFTANPGQFVTSLENLAKASGSGVTIDIVRKSLKRFERLGFLCDESSTTGRLITVINWEEYQGKPKQERVLGVLSEIDQAIDHTQNKDTEGVSGEECHSTDQSETIARPPNNNNRSLLRKDASASKNLKLKTPDLIWNSGVDLLVQCGEQEGKARSFLGKAIKDYSKAAVENAIEIAIRDNVVEPKAYIMGILQSNQAPNKLSYKTQADLNSASRGEVVL